MDIELPLNGGLGIPHVGVSRELGITAFANSEHRDVSNTFHDPKTALWHTESLAHSDRGAYSLWKGNGIATGDPELLPGPDPEGYADG